MTCTLYKASHFALSTLYIVIRLLASIAQRFDPLFPKQSSPFSPTPSFQHPDASDPDSPKPPSRTTLDRYLPICAIPCTDTSTETCTETIHPSLNYSGEAQSSQNESSGGEREEARVHDLEDREYYHKGESYVVCESYY